MSEKAFVVQAGKIHNYPDTAEDYHEVGVFDSYDGAFDCIKKYVEGWETFTSGPGPIADGDCIVHAWEQYRDTYKKQVFILEFEVNVPYIQPLEEVVQDE